MGGSYSRSKGIGFERKVARFLRDNGFDAQRNLGEYDGRNLGIDIEAFALLKAGLPTNVSRWRIPLGIQCKNTASERDLWTGLEEARAATPASNPACCVHNHERRVRFVIEFSGARYQVERDGLNHLFATCFYLTTPGLHNDNLRAAGARILPTIPGDFKAWISSAH